MTTLKAIEVPSQSDNSWEVHGGRHAVVDTAGDEVGTVRP
jgi:hypothetical protein